MRATQATKGYEMVEFTARLTNTSRESVWIFTEPSEAPYCRVFVRESAGVAWAEHPLERCGFGASLYQPDPGDFASFVIEVPIAGAGPRGKAGFCFAG